MLVSAPGEVKGASLPGVSELINSTNRHHHHHCHHHGLTLTDHHYVEALF